VERDGPASAALALSRLGVAVVTLGTGAAGLVRVAASEGSLHGPFTESRAVFSEARLHEWATDYPYGYRQVQDVNEFYISTSGVGVSDIPDRAVVVASTEMQAYPPNLLNVADDLAGRSRRFASAPSLAWLKAAIEKPRKLDGRITAWIPGAAPEGELTSSR
jgi:hypothetical protein